MVKSLATMLTIISMILTPAVYADGTGNSKYPSTKCSKDLVRDIYDDQNAELMDAIRKYYKEGDKQGMTDGQFCGWLRKRFEGDTTAKFGECQTCRRPEPETPEVERSFPEPFRDEMRRVARPQRERERERERDYEDEQPREANHGGGGGFMQSPFMGGLMGGLLGGAIGAFLVGRMGNQQQQPMFPPPQWGPQMGGPGGMRPMPGMLPFPGGQFGGGGIGGMQPFPGQFGQPVQPWAQPYMAGAGYGQYGNYGGAYGNYGATQYGYGQFGGGYAGGGYPPSVLPLAPQSAYSPYSVGGGIPQNHWNLINAGR